jgi:hypothetical protein
MCGAVPPLPQYAFMAWCLVKQRDNFTFTLQVTAVAQHSVMGEEGRFFFGLLLVLSAFSNKGCQIMGSTGAVLRLGSHMPLNMMSDFTNLYYEL